MKKVFLSIIFLMLTLLVMAQQALQLVDARNQQELSGAHVRLLRSTIPVAWVANSNAKGELVLPKFMALDTLLIQLAGYRSLALTGKALLNLPKVLAMDATPLAVQHPWCQSQEWPRSCCGNDFHGTRVFPLRESDVYWLCLVRIITYRVPLIDGGYIENLQYYRFKHGLERLDFTVKPSIRPLPAGVVIRLEE